LFEKAPVRSDPWPWHVPADLVEGDSEGRVLPDLPLGGRERQARLLAASSLPAITPRSLFSPRQQTLPIKLVPRSLVVEVMAPWGLAKSWHWDWSSVSNQNVSASLAERTHAEHWSGWSVRSCAHFLQTIAAEQHAWLCRVSWCCRDAAPTRHLSSAKTITGERLLKASTGRAMCKRSGKAEKQFSIF